MRWKELDWSEKLREGVLIAFLLTFLLCGVGGVAYIVGDAAYLGLDDFGWIPHTKVIPVFLKSSGWIAGEYKDCRSAVARNLNSLWCDDTSETHDLEVTFWGTYDTFWIKTAGRTRMWNCQLANKILTGTQSLVCRRKA
jgi:hypothetical protein